MTRRRCPDDLIFKVDYLGGQVGTFAINFSRPAGQVIAQYFQFLRLGREGYAKTQMAAYRVAQYIAERSGAARALTSSSAPAARRPAFPPSASR